MSIIVTMEHVRAAGVPGARVLCAPGIRLWAQRHDIDVRRFCREGMPIEDVERLGDAFALRVAAIARAGANDGDEA